jgi:hypothetical protein
VRNRNQRARKVSFAPGTWAGSVLIYDTFDRADSHHLGGAWIGGEGWTHTGTWGISSDLEPRLTPPFVGPGVSGIISHRVDVEQRLLPEKGGRIVVEGREFVVDDVDESRDGFVTLRVHTDA